MANMTGSRMELHCAIHQSPLNGLLSDTVSHNDCWIIDGSCSKRVTLELKKFSLAKGKDASAQDKVEIYSKYLAELVKLTWKCVSLISVPSWDHIKPFNVEHYHIQGWCVYNNIVHLIHNAVIIVILQFL